MFERYSVIDGDYAKKDKLYTIEIIDSSFNERVVAECNEDGLNVMSPIIAVYERRELNVGANLTKVIAYLCKRFKLEPKGFLQRNIAINKDIAKYKEDIEKYLTLL